MSTPEEKLRELGLILRPQGLPLANYVPSVRTGNLVFLAGHLPPDGSGGFILGKLGDTATVEDGYNAAQAVGLSLLHSLKEEIGELDRVTRVVRLFCMVNALPTFTQFSQVTNGASDLIVDVFGERGKHARASVGMVSLPLGVTVEIESVIEIRP